MTKTTKFKKRVCSFAIAAGFSLAAATGLAASEVAIDIQAQPLASALKVLGEQSNLQLIFKKNDLQALESNALAGEMSPEAALKQMLAGTGFTYEFAAENMVVVKRENTAEGGPPKRASDKRREREVEELIVTAQKREQRLLDVPISVSAFSGRQMAEAGITDLQSLSFAVPGLLVAETGANQRRISIRGIGNVFGGASLVGVYLDEASVVGLPSNHLDLRIYDIERVEVLKGPQGTLYGQGSVGGTIRYITKDPQLDGFSGEASVDGSLTSSGSPSQELKSVLNIPLADNLGLRLVGQYVNGGGWIDQPALAKKEINEYDLFNIRAKLLWQPTDNLEIKTTAIVHRNDAGPNQGEDENGNYHQAFGLLTTPAFQDDYNLLSVLVNYDFGGVELISSTSYLSVDKETRDGGGECCFPTGAGDELWNISFPRASSSADVLTQELRLSTDGSGPWNWTMGLFYRDAELIPGDTQNLLFGVPGGTPGVDLFEFAIFREERSKSWALFGETSYALTDNLEIGVGLRYFEDDQKMRTAATGPFQEETFDSLNPKLYISYGLTEDIRVYANAAKGFRSGGFNAANQPPFVPESVWSYELGTKMSLLGGRVNTELALFYSTYDDYQIIGVLPSVGNITSNAGEAQVQGVEVSLRWLATDDFEVGVNGNYMDTEFVKINATSSSHEVGDPVDIVPKYGYTLWGSYSFNWFDSSPGYMRLDYNQQGKSHFRNRSFGPAYHDASDVIDMLNTRIGWRNNNWAVELYAVNLLNEHGLLGPFHIELVSARPRPRTIGINVGYTF